MYHSNSALQRQRITERHQQGSSQDLVFLLAPIRDDFISRPAQGGKLHSLAGALSYSNWGLTVVMDMSLGGFGEAFWRAASKLAAAPRAQGGRSVLM
ncbi:uncharacterized [Tachysurus ichikawai]